MKRNYSLGEFLLLFVSLFFVPCFVKVLLGSINDDGVSWRRTGHRLSSGSATITGRRHVCGRMTGSFRCRTTATRLPKELF